LLPVERTGGNFYVGLGGGYVSAPLFSDEAVRKSIMSLIDEIAVQNKIKKIMFSIDSFENPGYNYLQKYKYLDTSILEYFIDLQPNSLMSECRRGHRCDIKKIRNNPDFSVFMVSRDNLSYELHEQYRKLHHKCSGRVARSKKTFDLQFEKIKDGNALLFGLKFKNKNIAFSYFSIFSSKAIYEAGSDDPDYSRLPLYHILVFSAMEYLKKLGFQYVATGQPSGPSSQFDYYPDKKQLGIALFKRGFGGRFRPNYRGIKYYNRDCLLKDVDLLVKNYILQ
jgi:hypothetical protein